MAQLSAGLLMFRRRNNEIEFFLVHPGGPYFAKKDEGFWTIPKGLCEPDEDLLNAAKREFSEETGIIPDGKFLALGEVKMKSGKIVHAWLFEGEWNEPDGISSNTFPLEWPPRSGKVLQVPEVDRAGWFDYETALGKINPQQQSFILKAAEMLSAKVL
jgi:predicted NUDIX family NTP pyrophosphohydrolase